MAERPDDLSLSSATSKEAALLQAGFCRGAYGLHVIVHATQARPRIDVDLKNEDGASAGHLSIADRAEALRLILALLTAAAYVGWVRAESEDPMRRILTSELGPDITTSGSDT